MVRQFGETTKAQVVDASQDPARGEPRPLSAHPAVLADRGPRDRPPADPDVAFLMDHGSPLFAVPCLVLIAALAIFEGYHWLHLIPNGSTRPTAILFLLGVVPATVALTRRLEGPASGALCGAARIGSVAVLLLGITELIVRDVPLTRAVGVTSLALAGVLLGLAVASEVGERRRTGSL